MLMWVYSVNTYQIDTSFNILASFQCLFLSKCKLKSKICRCSTKPRLFYFFPLISMKVHWKYFHSLIHDFCFPFFRLLFSAWACICYISRHNKPSFPRKNIFLLPTKTSTARLCIKVCKKPVSSFSNFLSLLLLIHVFAVWQCGLWNFQMGGYKIRKSFA